VSVPQGSNATTFVEMLRSRAEERPDADAVVFLDHTEREAGRATYAELDRKARSIAAELGRLGIAGERALLAIPPGVEYIAAVYGCLYAGVVAVTSPPPDPGREHAAPRIRKVADDADPRIVLTTGDVEPAIREVLAGHSAGAAAFMAVDSPELPSPDDWQPFEPHPQDVAILQYTSGATRLPRGVIIPHDRLMANCAAIHQAFELGPEDRGVAWLPPFHDMGLIGSVFQPVYAGGSLVQLAPATFLIQPMSWLRAISRYRGTVAGGPDFAFELLLKKTSPSDRASVDLSSWTLAFNGAELVRRETIDAFSDAFAAAGFRREAFYPCYGLAEATLIVSGGARGALPVTRPEAVSCGPAVAETQVRIVDPDSSSEVPEGQVGEIWVSGPGVAPGYWGRGDESAAIFEATLAGEPDGRRYLRTADLGFVTDGELYVTGRIADLIVSGDLAYYATDIERAATDAVAELRTGCAAAFQLAIGGEERTALVAEVKDGADHARTIEAARAAVDDRLGVELAAVALIAPRTLPRTTSGKIRRERCRALLEGGALDAVDAWSADHETP
jgi:acyl-CoA synthetase (AMP-forming)/AMP-acid ligase II